MAVPPYFLILLILQREHITSATFCLQSWVILAFLLLDSIQKEGK